MPTMPIENRVEIENRLRTHTAHTRQPLAAIRVRYRGAFAYITAVLPTGEVQPLCRLRYLGHDDRYGVALYRASHDDYEDTWLPNGSDTATPEDAFDFAANTHPH